jgi:hypothetical protein
MRKKLNTVYDKKGIFGMACFGESFLNRLRLLKIKMLRGAAPSDNIS